MVCPLRRSPGVDDVLFPARGGLHSTTVGYVYALWLYWSMWMMVESVFTGLYVNPVWL